MRERKCQMFCFLCVWVHLCSCGQTQSRLADSTEVCASWESPWNNGLSSLGLNLKLFSLSIGPTKQFSQPPPLYMPVLYKDIPAIYRMWTILLHTGWVSHWPPGLMKIPSISPPSLLHPITYRKAFYLTLPRLLLFVFTTLLPSSVALLLRFGWVLWSGPAL